VEDVEWLMCGTSARAVVAIESGWLERVRATPLVCYQLPAQGFQCIDEGAGYYVNPNEVEPIHKTIVDDPLAVLVDRGVELRVMPCLWDLRDRVIQSTLQFSIIRWRNAAPRCADPIQIRSPYLDRA
jgi:hypothetical protein